MAKIIDHTKEIESMLTTKSNIFLRTVADEIVNESTPKTPKKTGRLRMDILKQVLGLKGKVVWGKNYAAIREEVQAKRYTTPGTSKDFAKNAVKKTVERTSTIAKRVNLI